MSKPFVLIFSLICCPVYAHHLESTQFDWGGSASIYSTFSNDLSWYSSGDNPLNYSQATLHGSYSWNNVALRVEGLFVEEPRLHYALVDVFSGNLDTLYGIRVGKYHRSSFLVDDQRFNTATRRFVYLPTTHYYPAAEEWSTSAIGAQVYVRKAFGFLNITLKADRGKPWSPDRITRHEFSQLTNGQEIDDVDQWDNHFSSNFSLQLRYRDWRFLIAYTPDTGRSYTSTEHDVVPPFWMKQESISYGIERYHKKWLTSVEGFVTHLNSEYPTIPNSGTKLTAISYVLTAGYDFNNKWQLSGYTGQIFLSFKDRLPGTNTYVKNNYWQRDNALSVRYRVTPSFSLRGEAHYLNGNPIVTLGFGDDNNFTLDNTQNSTLFVFGFDYIF